MKALGFNFLKVQCFQATGFKYKPAPLHWERTNLQSQEKKLIAEIKKTAKQNQMVGGSSATPALSGHDKGY